MTNKEAIEELRELIEIDLHPCPPIYEEALNLAIGALMAYRDCKHCTHKIKVGNMNGCELWDCDFEDMRGGRE